VAKQSPISATAELLLLKKLHLMQQKNACTNKKSKDTAPVTQNKSLETKARFGCLEQRPA